jgi:hypothetical protein
VIAVEPRVVERGGRVGVGAPRQQQLGQRRVVRQSRGRVEGRTVPDLRRRPHRRVGARARVHQHGRRLAQARAPCGLDLVPTRPAAASTRTRDRPAGPGRGRGDEPADRGDLTEHGGGPDVVGGERRCPVEQAGGSIGAARNAGHHERPGPGLPAHEALLHRGPQLLPAREPVLAGERELGCGQRDGRVGPPVGASRATASAAPARPASRSSLACRRSWSRSGRLGSDRAGMPSPHLHHPGPRRRCKRR